MSKRVSRIQKKRLVIIGMRLNAQIQEIMSFTICKNISV